jgi:beta-mannosidase
LKDTAVQSHQKHPKGFETIDAYMRRDYPVPAGFADYIYVSQVMQREGISRAIEAHRRAMPYCMGTMFWQYNDCWPVTSWSTTDYYGRPKMLQYALKDLYAPVLVSVTEKNDSLMIYLVNDDTTAHKGVIGFQWMSLDGAPVRTSLTQAYAPAGTSAPAIVFSKKLLLDTLNPANGVLRVVFNFEKGKTAQALHYFVSPKDLQLSADPGLSFDISPATQPGAYSVTLRTIRLAKNVCMSVSDPQATFSDNGFDMLPGEERVIVIHSAKSAEELRKEIQLRTINQL